MARTTSARRLASYLCLGEAGFRRLEAPAYRRLGRCLVDGIDGGQAKNVTHNASGLDRADESQHTDQKSFNEP